MAPVSRLSNSRCNHRNRPSAAALARRPNRSSHSRPHSGAWADNRRLRLEVLPRPRSVNPHPPPCRNRRASPVDSANSHSSKLPASASNRPPRSVHRLRLRLARPLPVASVSSHSNPPPHSAVLRSSAAVCNSHNSHNSRPSAWDSNHPLRHSAWASSSPRSLSSAWAVPLPPPSALLHSPPRPSALLRANHSCSRRCRSMRDRPREDSRPRARRGGDRGNDKRSPRTRRHHHSHCFIRRLLRTTDSNPPRSLTLSNHVLLVTPTHASLLPTSTRRDQVRFEAGSEPKTKRSCWCEAEKTQRRAERSIYRAARRRIRLSLEAVCLPNDHTRAMNSS